MAIPNDESDSLQDLPLLCHAEFVLGLLPSFEPLPEPGPFAGKWSEDFVREEIERVVKAGIEELARLGVGTEYAIEQVTARAKGIKAFSEVYIGDSIKVRFCTSTLNIGADRRSL